MPIERTVQHYTMLPTSLGMRQFFDPQPTPLVARRAQPPINTMHYQTRAEMFPCLVSQDEPANVWRNTAAFGSYEWASGIMRGAA